MLCLFIAVIFLCIKPMDYFLSPEIREIRARIKQVSDELRNQLSDISEHSALSFSPSVKDEKKLLAELKRLGLNPFCLTKDFSNGKDSSRALWAVEQLACHFPSLALKIVVHNYLFVRISGLAKKQDKNFPQTSGAKPPELAKAAFPGNHVFLSPLIRHQLSSCLTKSLTIKDSNWKLFTTQVLSFPFPEAEYLMVPAINRNNCQNEDRIDYFLIKKEDLQPIDLWPKEGLFPLRPIRLTIKKPATLIQGSAFLTLEQPVFQKILADFSLALTACFSGWTRACWLNFAVHKPFSPGMVKLESELSVLVTELEKLRFYLYRLSIISSKIGLIDFLTEVEKLSQKGLTLASRAWKFNRIIEHIFKSVCRRKDET